MGTEIKHAIVVEMRNGSRILLPPYRFEQDAKLACSRLIEIEGVERAMTAEQAQPEPVR